MPNVAYPKGFGNQHFFNVFYFKDSPDSKQGQLVNSNTPRIEPKLSIDKQMEEPEKAPKKLYQASEDVRAALPVELMEEDQVEQPESCINQDGTHICPGVGLNHETMDDFESGEKIGTANLLFKQY